ncbi:MAG: hypothetical protein RR523_11875 [Cetobacterium sp.]
MDWGKTLLSASNLIGGISLIQAVKNNLYSVAFIFIAHATGMITEFMADVLKETLKKWEVLI